MCITRPGMVIKLSSSLGMDSEPGCVEQLEESGSFKVQLHVQILTGQFGQI